MRRAFQTAAIVSLMTALAACASPSQTTNQFAEFAKAGATLADSTPPLLDAAFAETVKTDSLILATARGGITDRKSRIDALAQSDKQLAARVQVFADLKRHSQLLRSYFVTLGFLADASGDSALGDSAKGIVDQLGILRPSIANANFEGVAVDTLVQTAVPIAVGAFRSLALKHELEARAKTIASEIDLQRAALAAIAKGMEADMKTRLASTDAESIVRPFVEPGPLPGDWDQRRLASLQRQTALEAVQAAAQASDNLRQSFIALTESGGSANLTLLISDVSEVASLVQSLKVTKT